MKTKLLFLLFFCCMLTMHAQVSKTVNCTAGALGMLLTTDELATVTNLTLTGTIDYRDFNILRANMPVLSILDLSAVAISSYSGYPASAIPHSAFAIGSSKLTSVLLPTTLISISPRAFSYCRRLTSITIPASVIEIYSDAFRECRAHFFVDEANLRYSSVDGVLFDKSKGALLQCPASKKGIYVIPAWVSAVYPYAFSQCVDLTAISIPSTVRSISESMFSGCKGLTSITIPPLVTSIGYAAFSGCTGLTSVTIPPLVTAIGGTAFSGCTGLSSVTIPPSVKTISRDAFNGCTSLLDVLIPASVTAIEFDVFAGSSAFLNVDAANPNFSSVDGVLFNKDKTTLMYCPISKKGDYIVPSSVTVIDRLAFRRCGGLNSVSIPSSVTSMGILAFASCSGKFLVDGSNPIFSSVDGVLFNKAKTQLMSCPTSKVGDYSVPVSVTKIAENSFEGCSSLTSVVVPNFVDSIGNLAFVGCSGLTSVSIPASVVNLGFGVFQDCVGLTSFTTSAKAPLSISPDIFYQVALSKCTLYVPVGAKALYQEGYVWKNFGNIVEQPGLSVKSKSAKGIKLYPNPVVESLAIDGFSGVSQISIVNASGKVMMQQDVVANQALSVGSLLKGIYFVKVGNGNDAQVLEFLKK